MGIEEDRALVVKTLTEQLLETDALTPNEDGTPSFYTVHADDVETLVDTILTLATPERPTPPE